MSWLQKKRMTIFPGTPPQIVGGDLNGNEIVQIEDAIIALKVLAVVLGIALSETEIVIAYSPGSVGVPSILSVFGE
jgi:hypothetical protein